jgi:adenylate cyclase class 2
MDRWENDAEKAVRPEEAGEFGGELMGVEIEAKMAVEDHEPVRRALLAQGAKQISRVLEINRILDTDDRLLQSAGKGLRVRVNRNLATQEEQTVLTIKGPLKPGPLKSREESELTVAEPQAALRFLETLGYRPVLTFEKRRETWELADCKVELDELPMLGRFVEIEGPGEASVMAVRNSLGLGEHPVIKTSYVGLLIDYLKKHNLPTDQATFGSG